MASDDTELLANTEDLNSVIHRLQAPLGAYIFKAWHFPAYLIAVVLGCHQFERVHEGDADYVDIVQVALIEGSLHNKLDITDHWASVPAFRKLGIDTQTRLLDLEANKIMFDETEALFR
jgi:HD-like signal output (HDOD) protein